MINSPSTGRISSIAVVYTISIAVGIGSMMGGRRISALRRVCKAPFEKLYRALRLMITVDNPWTVSSNFTQRQILGVPDQAWEKTPYGRPFNVRLSSNEGPEQLTNPQTGQNFVIYSAARSDNRNYCLGQLELIGSDPMNVQDWRKNTQGCVFYQNPSEEAYGVGHASFTTSPDGKENWIVYHGMRDPSNGWSARTIRTQMFTWNSDGSPKFPKPGYGPYPVPSGQV